MKNKLTDLNNHLFAQIERLGDEDLTEDQIDREVKRAGAIVDVSDQVLRTADITLKAAKLKALHGDAVRHNLPLIGSKSE